MSLVRVRPKDADRFPLTSTPVKREQLPAVRTEGEAARPPRSAGRKAAISAPPPVGLSLWLGSDPRAPVLPYWWLWVSPLPLWPVL